MDQNNVSSLSNMIKRLQLDYGFSIKDLARFCTTHRQEFETYCESMKESDAPNVTRQLAKVLRRVSMFDHMRFPQSA
mgnify:CR=1 FL=1|jgi:hypothetical protein